MTAAASAIHVYTKEEFSYSAIRTGQTSKSTRITHPGAPRRSNITISGTLELGAHNRHEDDVDEEDNSCDHGSEERCGEGEAGAEVWTRDAGGPLAKGKERQCECKEGQSARWIHL